MLSRSLVRRLVRFVVVGVIVAGIFMGLNWAWGHLVGRQVAFLLSYPPALGVHFCLNKWWTFGNQQSVTGRQVGEYLVMVGITFSLQWIVFTALARWTTFPAWLEAGLANVAQTAISYLFMQARIFRGPSPA